MNLWQLPFIGWSLVALGVILAVWLAPSPWGWIFGTLSAIIGTYILLYGRIGQDDV